MLFVHRKFLSDFLSEWNFDLKIFLAQAMGFLIGELLDYSELKSGHSDIFKSPVSIKIEKYPSNVSPKESNSGNPFRINYIFTITDF
ncbi:MAG: hypothetical protein A2097_00050 [Desulfobacula sp. GWF2_41_7]|nr:MAG: hypothetical protein A2097_00050 [Desulfobacula sp. GWF2_41_7]